MRPEQPKAIPTQKKKRDAILVRLAEHFEPDRTYTERQVSNVLRRFHEDTATLRREMVGLRLFVPDHPLLSDWTHYG